MPLIKTVALPVGNVDVAGCPVPGSNGHWCVPPATAAGKPPISTVGSPGGRIDPP